MGIACSLTWLLWGRTLNVPFDDSLDVQPNSNQLCCGCFQNLVSWAALHTTNILSAQALNQSVDVCAHVNAICMTL
jgi:hypothetical protein